MRILEKERGGGAHRAAREIPQAQCEARTQEQRPERAGPKQRFASDQSNKARDFGCAFGCPRSLVRSIGGVIIREEVKQSCDYTSDYADFTNRSAPARRGHCSPATVKRPEKK